MTDNPDETLDAGGPLGPRHMEPGGAPAGPTDLKGDDLPRRTGPGESPHSGQQSSAAASPPNRAPSEPETGPLLGSTQRDGLLRTEVLAAAERAIENLARRQSEDGSWLGDYGGPMFLLPMYVMLCRASGQEIPEPRRAEMRRYLHSAQRPDGSVGMHVEGEGSLFTSTLSYVALRLLGEPAESDAASAMRDFVRREGTPLLAAPWAKWMLAVLRLYEYEGLNPVTPELWLLPYAVPVHPGRLWCHARQVYLPMAYLYGVRARVQDAPDLQALRRELYDQPYETIVWHRYRDAIRAQDVYTPLHPVMRMANRVLRGYEWLQTRWPDNPLRRRALDEVMHHVRYEDAATHDIDIGPVNAVLNTLCHHFAAPGGEDFRRGFAALEAYLWQGHDGLKFQGYNSSQLWDTVFAAQAVLATPLAESSVARDVLARAHAFVRDNQILEDLPEAKRHYRDPSRGGWPFSTRAHGWPITDCTAEGFKTAVALEDQVDRPVDEELLRDAVRLLLGWQNPDGGWPSYERKRAGAWMEWFNPSFVFGDIMVDYSYPECTSACLQALAVARRRFPGAFHPELGNAISQGQRYLRAQQRPDGSWYGSWGICFTYGTWFAVTGLRATGVPPSDPAIQRAMAFLLRHQRPDGSWGEDPRACAELRWIDSAEGQVVRTSWALLALLAGGCADRDALERGVRFLLSRQAKDGSWPREGIAGMFNKTCAITYDNYRHYFPLWALGRWLASPFGAA